LDSFHRAKPPDNRRTLPLHIKIHNYEENMEFKKTSDEKKPLKKKVETHERIYGIAAVVATEEKEQVWDVDFSFHFFLY
jgi:hypothetical protein